MEFYEILDEDTRIPPRPSGASFVTTRQQAKAAEENGGFKFEYYELQYPSDEEVVVQEVDDIMETKKVDERQQAEQPRETRKVEKVAEPKMTRSKSLGVVRKPTPRVKAVTKTICS